MTVPSFEAFYGALHGRPPFPWQARLARQVAEREEWPAEVGVPTGLGKTACLDIAVWWLASQAERSPEQRTAPVRIWWVVNRRLLVDATAQHADEMSAKLFRSRQELAADGGSDVLKSVAERLCGLSVDPDAPPLDVIRLRGGVASGRPADPSVPAVILSTLPMYGSRLLFRGYGTSRGMRPVDAALAGTDSLVLLDEAHLAPHLISLIPALAECHPDSLPLLARSRSRPQLVALTATGDASKDSRFDLDSADELNPLVRRRLDAPKPMAVLETAGVAGRALAEQTSLLLQDADRPSSCIVFANTPGTARSAFDRLRKSPVGRQAEVLLLTGRSREREAEITRRRVLDGVHGMPAGRDQEAVRERHLIVVATQTLEVGADLDAEYLVTEACGVRALTQRLGRLNRLGDRKYARAVYVHLPPPKSRSGAGNKVWPVYGAEPALVLERLKAAPVGTGGHVELSPRRVADVLGVPDDHGGRAPEVLEGLLWEWVKTTTPPEGEAPVEPFFSGIEGPTYSVSLIWRAHVPGDGDILWPRAADREAVGVPIGELRNVFAEDEVLFRLTSDRATIDEVAPDRLRPGDTIVLPCDRGLLDEFGWAPSSRAPVVDVSVMSHGLPLSTEGLKRLCGVSVSRDVLRQVRGENEDGEELERRDQARAVESLLADLACSPPNGWERPAWSDYLSRLSREVVAGRREVARLRRPHEVAEPPSDDRDERSLGPAATRLDPHCRAVGARAGAIGRRIGIDSELADVLRLAGRLHDIGKADPRFQRWLDPTGRATEPVAKSRMPRYRWDAARVAASWPRGGRHEALSARLAERWLAKNDWGSPEARDLLLHLVVSHHGSGRPLVRPVADGTLGVVASSVEQEVLEVRGDLESVDWSQPSRFRRLNTRFGPWGLALLEAVVRLADHQVSGGAVAVPEGLQ